eukprot:gb/GECG01014733.1/.p1 GENE.gb/GECG01014733.1/~~gb/GECG01014733.1/.p1  ORF type:complete len:129 (+),score=1.01 gb/GECG01014733.1/:1-387(+)
MLLRGVGEAGAISGSSERHRNSGYWSLFGTNQIVFDHSCSSPSSVTCALCNCPWIVSRSTELPPSCKIFPLSSPTMYVALYDRYLCYELRSGLLLRQRHCHQRAIDPIRTVPVEDKAYTFLMITLPLS